MELIETLDVGGERYARVRAATSPGAIARGGSAPDPVTTEVIRHGLNSVATQVAVALRRTAFSPVIYEVNDFACALFDSDVRLLAQAQVFPQFLGTMSFCVERSVEAVGGPDELRPGDVLFSTYAYDTGSHSQDAAVVVPGFMDDELVGYAGIKAHHMDIAAKDPYCTDTTDLFQEGVIFPGVRIMRAGEFDRDLLRTVLANSRLPRVLEGDLNAQIVAARIGLQGLERVIGKYGRETFAGAVEHMFDHAEGTVRSFFAGVPDGRYVGQGALDSNGVSPEQVPFEIAVEVSGDEVVVDFSGAPEQQAGPVNCPLASTVSAARMAVMALAGGSEMINEGHIRAIEVRAREGSLFHPSPPAPVYLYSWTALQAIDVVHRALAETLPEVIGSGTGGDIGCVVWWGTDADGVLWSDAADYFCGQGASPTKDGGAPLIHISSSGMRNSPVEVWESRRPMLVEHLELVPDSGGAGERRGGLGVSVCYRALEECFFTSTIERTMLPGWGLAGGHPGRPNSAHVTSVDGSVSESAKATGVRLSPGSKLTLVVGGGGGYGPPELRAPAAVEADLEAGYVTEQHARELYPHAVRSRTLAAAAD